MDNDSRKLNGIQVLRAVAALLVVSEHSYNTFCARLGFPPLLQTHFWALSSMGVCLFFAISGFIMMYTTSRDFGRPGASKNFLLRRLWRIVPLYWTMTLIEAGKLKVTGAAISWGDLARSFLFVPYRNPAGLVHPVLEAGWTLNFEMLFYAAFTAALMLPLRSGVAILLAGLGGLVAWGTLGGTGFITGETGTLAAFVSNPIILFFLTGIGVWFVWRAGACFRASAVVWSATLAALLAIGCIAAARDIDHDVWPLLPVVGLLLLAGLCAPAFREGGIAIRIAVMLGDASYSLYLTHSFLLGQAGRLTARFGAPSTAWPLFVGVTLVGAAVLGVLVHRWIERPLLRLLRPLFFPTARPSATVSKELPIPHPATSGPGSNGRPIMSSSPSATR